MGRVTLSCSGGLSIDPVSVGLIPVPWAMYEATIGGQLLGQSIVLGKVTPSVLQLIFEIWSSLPKVKCLTYLTTQLAMISNLQLRPLIVYATPRHLVSQNCGKQPTNSILSCFHDLPSNPLYKRSWFDRERERDGSIGVTNPKSTWGRNKGTFQTVGYKGFKT